MRRGNGARGAGAALVIFDCDGVLIDSELLSAEVLLDELARIGVTADLRYFFQNCLGRHFSAVAERISRDHGCVIGTDFEMQYVARLLDRFRTELRPMPGALDLLARMETGYCVATNSKTLRAAKALALAGISDLVGGEVFTGSMVTRGKPWPDLFLLAAERHGVTAEDCLVVEDSELGIEAAHAAGMPVWRFTGGSHYKEGRRWIAKRLPVDLEFNDLADFLPLLNRR